MIMATKLSAVTRITYKNEVGNYVISYTTKTENGEAVKEINADIRKGDSRSGNLYIQSDGTQSMSFNPSVPKEDVKTLVSTMLDDAEQIEPGVFAYIRGYSGTSQRASFFALEHFDGNEMVASLEAAEVKFDPETKHWTADRYTTREFDSLHNERFTQHRNLDTLINLDATELGRVNELIKTMKIGELNHFIRQQREKGSDMIGLFEVERHTRYAYPISTFILTLIGVSLSSRKVRGGTGLHIGIGITLCFSYILFGRFFEEFAKSGVLPAGFSVWIPNLIYLVIAVFLYRNAPK